MSEIRVPAEPPSGEGSLGADSHLLGPSRGGEPRAIMSCFSSQGEKPTLRLHPQVLIASRGPHLQRPSHWGLGLQYMNFGGTKTFSPSHIYLQYDSKWQIIQMF